MDFRGNLEVGGPEEAPEAKTPGGPTRNMNGNKALSGITSRGQEIGGEYNRDGYLVADRGRS